MQDVCKKPKYSDVLGNGKCMRLWSLSHFMLPMPPSHNIGENSVMCIDIISFPLLYEAQILSVKPLSVH